MGVGEADTQDEPECEGSMMPPSARTARWALCPKCGARGESCSNAQGDVVMMPHPKGQK